MKKFSFIILIFSFVASCGSVSEGFKKTIFFPSLTFCLCFLKEISSIKPPSNEMEPKIFSFSILSLSELSIDSVLETFFQ